MSITFTRAGDLLTDSEEGVAAALVERVVLIDSRHFGRYGDTHAVVLRVFQYGTSPRAEVVLTKHYRKADPSEMSQSGARRLLKGWRRWQREMIRPVAEIVEDLDWKLKLNWK